MYLSTEVLDPTLVQSDQYDIDNSDMHEAKGNHNLLNKR